MRQEGLIKRELRILIWNNSGQACHYRKSILETLGNRQRSLLWELQDVEAAADRNAAKIRVRW